MTVPRLSIELLADAALMRWPVGQRWCYVAAALISSRPPQVGALVDDRGRALTGADLATLFHVDRSTVDRFRERVLTSGRMLELAGELVWTTGALTVEDVVDPTSLIDRADGKSAGKSQAKSHADGAPPSAVHSPDPLWGADPDSFTQDQQPLQLQGSSKDLLDQELLVAAAAHTPSPWGRDTAQRGETADADVAPDMQQLGRILSAIADADERTALTLVALRQAGATQPLFERALLSLERRRQRQPRLQSEARYLVATISRLRAEARVS